LPLSIVARPHEAGLYVPGELIPLPLSGSIPELPHVEKVLAAVEANFLRAADASNAVRHGGPHQLEQNLSATFFFA
jgi:hypothetical protein